jgi:hypothetical protein
MHMNKILIGLILGAVLGMIDGATAWFTPEARTMMLGIIIGSTVKGIIAGVAAGIFARKVNSTIAGVIFGLIVGLGLAYWVAAMQGKYYFEIMLPGSIVGAILGWATQRYGKPARLSSAAAMMMLVALFGVNAFAHDHDMKPAPSNAVFEKLKSLAGTWDANMLKPDGQKTTVEYRVSANGTVVQETMFPGTPMEMINMYTVDGDGILATHYCAGDNQPVLRLNAQKSNANQLVFDFVSVQGKSTDSYINGVTMKFTGDGKVEELWSATGTGPHMALYLNSKR